MLRCRGRKGRCGKRYERRCRKVCWGMGEVRVDVRKGEVREEMWESVLGPHTLTHFPTPHPFLSPHPSPSLQHTSPLTPYTFPHPSPHFSTLHTSFLTHPLTPTHFPTPPPTPPIPLPTAPYNPTHFPTHPMHSPTSSPPQFGLCGKVTM